MFPTPDFDLNHSQTQALIQALQSSLQHTFMNNQNFRKIVCSLNELTNGKAQNCEENELYERRAHEETFEQKKKTGKVIKMKHLIKFKAKMEEQC